MKNYLISASVAISALVLQGCGTAQSIKQEAVGYEPLNVILMIGDGMGIPQVSSAFYF